MNLPSAEMAPVVPVVLGLKGTLRTEVGRSRSPLHKMTTRKRRFRNNHGLIVINQFLSTKHAFIEDIEVHVLSTSIRGGKYMKVWDSIDKDLTNLFHQQAATDNPVLVSIRAGARVCVFAL